MSLLLGITGGIGSGKSLVSKVFSVLGVPVYEADARGKWLLNHDPEVRAQVQELLGAQVYNTEGADRKKIAAVVFNQPEKLEGLNQIVHPAVGRDFASWVEAHQKHPYLLKEAAILFESGANKGLDKIILVTAPEEIRLQRVQQRDAASAEEVRARMERQWTDERKIPLSDYRLINDGKTMLLPQIIHIHQSILALSEISD